MTFPFTVSAKIVARSSSPSANVDPVDEYGRGLALTQCCSDGRERALLGEVLESRLPGFEAELDVVFVLGDPAQCALQFFEARAIGKTVRFALRGEIGEQGGEQQA